MSDNYHHGSPPALPLAYLITFRCYGTWLHGDPRGSMDRDHNVYGAPMIPASEGLENSDRRQLKHPPVTLDARQRRVVEAAIRGVCAHRQYVLHALNVRTNHVHCVVAVPRPSASTSSPSAPTVARPSASASGKPEPMLDAFKAYATRALRQAGLIGSNTRLWSRHGSTIYLWTEQNVAKAIESNMLRWDKEMSCSGGTRRLLALAHTRATVAGSSAAVTVARLSGSAHPPLSSPARVSTPRTRSLTLALLTLFAYTLPCWQHHLSP